MIHLCFGTTWPHTASYSGLRTPFSCASGRRIAALNDPPSDVPDDTRVGATAAAGTNSEERTNSPGAAANTSAWR